MRDEGILSLSNTNHVPINSRTIIVTKIDSTARTQQDEYTFCSLKLLCCSISFLRNLCIAAEIANVRKLTNATKPPTMLYIP